MDNNEKIKVLTIEEHIRLRPALYVGKLEDGSDADDGLYILLRELIDNSVDEYRAGFGDKIIIDIDNNRFSVRDFGRGLDFDWYEHYFENSIDKGDVGITCVRLIIVASLSSEMEIISYRSGLMKRVETSRGKVANIDEIVQTNEPDGISISFIPDYHIFKNYSIRIEHIRNLLKQFAICNPKLKLEFCGESFYAPNGMKELITETADKQAIGHILHIQEELSDIAIAPVISTECPILKAYVNGHPTISGGTHVHALRNALYKSLKQRFSLRLLKCDISVCYHICINIKIEDPIFESCNKDKLDSKKMSNDGIALEEYLVKLLADKIPSFFDKNPLTEKAFVMALTNISPIPARICSTSISAKPA